MDNKEIDIIDPETDITKTGIELDKSNKEIEEFYKNIPKKTKKEKLQKMQKDLKIIKRKYINDK